MSNESGTGTVLDAIDRLLRNRAERAKRESERFEREFGSARTDALRYFTLPPSPGSNWVRDKYMGAHEGPTWMSPKPNRLKLIAWYVIDRILVPTLVVAAGILSAVAVLVGMKM